MVEQTLWTTYSPTSTNATDAQEYALGVTWYTVTPGWCLGAKWRFPSTLPTGSVTAKLWRVTPPDTVQANATELASATFASPTAGVVNEVRWSSPVAVTANTIYVVSIKTADRYVVSSNFFTVTVTSGDLRAPQGNTDPLGTGTVFNGKLNTNAGHLFPHQSFSFSNYWVDTIFTTDDPSGANKSSSDTGTITDAQTVTAALAGSDTATLSEGQTLATSRPSSDSATLLEGQTLATSRPSSDTATLSEANTLSAVLAGLDTASLSEGNILLAVLAGSDTASLTEGWTLTVHHNDTDSIGLTDTSGPIRLLSGDAITMAEGQVLTAVLSSSDSAILTDIGIRTIEGEGGVSEFPLTIVRPAPGLTVVRQPPELTIKREPPGIIIKGES